jgi:hypothetical protein
MSHSFDIFRMGANGVDPNGGTGRSDQMRARTEHSADPPFEHGIHHHPDSQWGQHPRYMNDTADMAGFPRSNYGNTAAYEPYPASRMNAQAWRGRNEDYDFWGRERHEGEVTLAGTVDTRMAKRAAEEAGDHVRGVKDIHNQLRVRPQEAVTPYPNP